MTTDREASGADGESSRPWEPIPLARGVEFDLVRRFLASVGPGPSLPVPPGDDAAALPLPPGELLVISSDAAVEGVHFRREWMTWETVGYRAAVAALSDLAAMAARPRGVLVSLCLPPELEADVVDALGTGLGRCLAAPRIPLLGGDLCRSPGPVFLDVTAVGSCSRPVTRRGSLPGDELWVTGRLGGAAAALWDLSRQLEPDPRSRRGLERPVPRLREAAWLGERVELHAMIDLSDGLAGDVAHLAAASGRTIEVEADAIPLAPALEEYANRDVALRLAVGGGEDYELLFTAAPGSVETEAEEFEERFALELRRVGRVLEEGTGEVRWVDRSGRRIRMGLHGYDHFAKPR